jgi:hypothetical protein
MGCNTIVNVQTVVVGTTPVEILGFNPRRKAFSLSPLPGTGFGQAQQSNTYTTAGTFVFPITGGLQLLDLVQCWGSGGSGGTDAVNGGAGGAGGCYAATPNVYVGNTAYVSIDVDAGGNAGESSVTDSSGNVLVAATSGDSGAGTSGAGVPSTSGCVGLAVFAGGGGSNGFAAVSGGGGGSGAGTAANGVSATTQVGAVAPAGGGNGGNGGGINTPGANGHRPGGAAGGSGITSGAAGTGANGTVNILWTPKGIVTGLSLDFRSVFLLGQGVWNYPNLPTQRDVFSDEFLGNAVTYPIFAVAGSAGVPLTIAEFLYERDIGTKRAT